MAGRPPNASTPRSRRRAVWAGDASLWKKDEAHRKTIAGALGWLTIAERMTDPGAGSRGARGAVSRKRGPRPRSRDGRVVSRAARLRSSFGRRAGFPRLEVLDSTEPSSVLAAAEGATPGRTIYVVSSKSGTTLEPNLFFDYFFALAGEELGAKAGERFVVVTDPGTPLEEVARSRNAEVIVLADPAIGGRYSALSPSASCRRLSPAWTSRRFSARARGNGRRLPGPDRGGEPRRRARRGDGGVRPRGARQAHLLGRDARRPVRHVGGAARGGVDGQGGQGHPSRRRGTARSGGGVRRGPLLRPDRRRRRLPGFPPDSPSSKRRGHPVATFAIRDAYDLGAEMFRWEFATALAGALLEINPFDQPNVQEAKDRTNEILSDTSGPPGARRAHVGDGSRGTARIAPARGLLRDHGLRGVDAGQRGAPRANPRSRSATRSVSRRQSGSAHGSSTRPASSTRAGRTRACSCR